MVTYKVETGLPTYSISRILHVISGHQGASINIQEAPGMSRRVGMFVRVALTYVRSLFPA